MRFVNRAKMTTATTGTGTITLGSAVSSFQSFSVAGIVDADIVRYVIEDGAAWEIGAGTYTAAGTTLTRGMTESSTGSALSLSGSATVFLTAASSDLQLGTQVETITTTGGSTTLTRAQYTAGTIIATGTLTSSPTFVLPNVGRWTVINRTTNAGVSQWNPSDKAAAITLSNGNLTSTWSSAAAWTSERSVPVSSGKIYFEVTISVLGTGAVFGVSNAAASISTFIGADTNGYGWSASGAVFFNNAASQTWGTFTTGDVICFALDCTNKKLWMRKGSGVWNNASSATQDPASNLGGIDISAIYAAGNAVYVAASGQNLTSTSANFGASAFSQTAPTGFSAAGSVIYDLATKTAAGTGVSVSQGKTAVIVSDGTNTAYGHSDPVSVGLGSQAANAIFAGPAAGGAALPNFRPLNAADITVPPYSLGTTGGTVATNAVNGNLFTLTLNANGTLANPTNLKAGGRYEWVITQDVTGSRTLAYGTAFKWVGGVAPVASTAANAVDRIRATSADGSTLLAVMEKGFA